MTSYSAELLSLFDPRFLDHRPADLNRFNEFQTNHADFAKPAAVELGCNTGASLVSLAKAYAPARVVGIEWKSSLCDDARARLKKHGIENAVVVQGDARIAIPLLFEPESVSAFFVYFPDPWWKNRHVDRRLLDPLFLRVLARRLTLDGRLYLKSDVFDYLYRVRAFAEVSQALQPLPAALWPDERAWGLSTREQKSMSAAIPFGRGYYRRNPAFTSVLPTEPERADDFLLDEDLDPVRIIKGAAPLDKAMFAARRAKSVKAESED